MDILSDRNMLIKVIDSLKKQQEKTTSERNVKNLKQLFADDATNSREKIFLVVSLIKLPPIPEDGKVPPITIKSPIPHSFVDEFTNILLITRDLKGNGRDYMPSVDGMKYKLRKHDALGLVSELMSINQLRKEYSDFENRRNLARQYDIVLCDKLVMPTMGKNLGKAFYSMKKKPLQVNLDRKDLKVTIEKCLSNSVLHLNLEGSCSSVQIGRMNQGSEEIADNILSTITTWKKLIPGGWINIRSINLKSETSKSLPLFVTTTLPKDVPEVVNPNLLKDEVIAQCTEDNKTLLVTRFSDVQQLRKTKVGENKYLGRELKRPAPATKYDPATNLIIKNKEIVLKNERGNNTFKRKVNKPIINGGRYFKKEKISSATKGKGQKKKLKFTMKKSSNKITKGSQSRKSRKGEKSGLNRKNSVQPRTDTRTSKNNRKNSVQHRTDTKTPKNNRKRSAQPRTDTKTFKNNRKRSVQPRTDTKTFKNNRKRSAQHTDTRTPKKRKVSNE
ncbi:UNVERIFIED_CONTAM: hypothetical protein RMT77_006607 [Armadillidium vulgare]